MIITDVIFIASTVEWLSMENELISIDSEYIINNFRMDISSKATETLCFRVNLKIISIISQTVFWYHEVIRGSIIVATSWVEYMNENRLTYLNQALNWTVPLANLSFSV